MTQSPSGGEGVAGQTNVITNDSGTTATPTTKSEQLPKQLNESVNLTDNQNTPFASSQQTTERKKVIVVATTAEAINRSQLAAMGAVVGTQHGARIEATIDPQKKSKYLQLPWVESINQVITSSPTHTTDEGLQALSIGKLHEQGITGDGVRVGVIGGGFDLSSHEIDGHVTATSSFHPSGLGVNTKHGTAVAGLVADTAPNASLYLANYHSSIDFAEAIDWMRSNDVDIIVMSRSYPLQPEDGSGYIDTQVKEATSDGILWVNSAGNYGTQHWQGTGNDADSDSYVEFQNGIEVNYLNKGQLISAGTPVSVYARWTDWPKTSADYDIYLVNSNLEVVAQSTNTQIGFSRPIESITTRVPADGYYGIIVVAANVADSKTLELYTGSSSLQYVTTQSSMMSPSTAKPVFSVGALDLNTGKRASYSSAGPTNDGRRGLDVMAPSGVESSQYEGRFYGTSASAPYVAGAAALVMGVNDSADSEYTKRILRQTAQDMGAQQADVYTGFGRVNATRAVTAAAPPVPLTIQANRTVLAPGEYAKLTVTRSDTGAPVNASLTTSNDQAWTGADGVAYYVAGDPGQVTVTASAPQADVQYAPANLTLTVTEQQAPITVTTANQTASPGSTTTVPFTITNTADQPIGTALNITGIPSEWEITQVDTAGGQWKAESRNFLWTQIAAGEEVTSTVTLTLPADASNTTITGSATTSLDVNTSVTTAAEITVKSSSSIPVAIAGADREVSTTELLKAVSYWQQGVAVPGTNGKELSTRDLLSLISYWQQGTTVTS